VRVPLRKVIEWGALGAIFVLAALLRLSSLSAVHGPGGWTFLDPDTHYHLRRVELLFAQGRMPSFDPWLSHPDGAWVQWHVGYDLLVAGVVRASCGPLPARACLETAAALSTPLFGLLALAAVFGLGRRLGGAPVGLMAALLFALYPFAAGSALLGMVDHHVLEPLCVALVLWGLAAGRSLLAGGLAGLSLALFPTALLPVGTCAAALLVDRLTRPDRARAQDMAAVKFVGAAWLVAWPVVVTSGFADRVEPAAASRFHLAVLGAALLGAAALEALVRGAPRQLRWAAPLVLAGIGYAFALLLAPELAALQRFARSEGLWTGIGQQQPLARSAIVGSALAALGIALAALALRDGRAREQPGLRLLGLVAAPLWCAGLWQVRFLMPAVAPFVVLIAYALQRLYGWLVAGHAGSPVRTRRLGRATFAGCTLLALLPGLETLRARPTPEQLQDGARILRRLGDAGAAAPAGAVLSDWVWGHHVLYLARRPAVASPFILSGHDRANVAARRALLASSEHALYAVMQQRRAPLLLVSRLFDRRTAAASLGLPVPPHAAGEALMAPTLDGYARLQLVDAEPGARLFRLVRGAALVGTTTPGASIEARLRASVGRTRPSRVFRTRSDRNGQFELRLSEPTQGVPEHTYLVTGPWGRCALLLPEKQVESGARVPLASCTGTAGQSPRSQVQ